MPYQTNKPIEHKPATNFEREPPQNKPTQPILHSTCQAIPRATNLRLLTAWLPMLFDIRARISHFGSFGGLQIACHDVIGCIWVDCGKHPESISNAWATLATQQSPSHHLQTPQITSSQFILIYKHSHLNVALFWLQHAHHDL